MTATLFFFLLADALAALVFVFLMIVAPQLWGNSPPPQNGFWLPVTRRSREHNVLTAHRRRLTRLHEQLRDMNDLSQSYENEGLIGHVEVLDREKEACQKKIKEEAETIQRLKKQQRERRFREHTSGPRRLGS